MTDAAVIVLSCAPSDNRILVSKIKILVPKIPLRNTSPAEFHVQDYADGATAGDQNRLARFTCILIL